MRRWNWIPRRFSLRLLLLAMLGLACLFAWYGNRMRAIQRERERLAGSWELIWINGRSDGSYPLHFGGDDGTILYPPRNGVGKIDFLVQDAKGGKSTSRAIYRFESHGMIRVAQNDVDKPRPTDFDAEKCDSLFIVRSRRAP